jgi:hypothetical protein
MTYLLNTCAPIDKPFFIHYITTNPFINSDPLRGNQIMTIRHPFSRQIVLYEIYTTAYELGKRDVKPNYPFVDRFSSPDSYSEFCCQAGYRDGFLCECFLQRLAFPSCTPLAPLVDPFNDPKEVHF